VVIVAALLVAVRVLPVKSYIVSALEWTENLGVWAPVFTVVLYVLACVLMVPGSIITIAAGFLFGLLWGTVVVSIASTIGACAAFLIGRTFARGWVQQKVADRPKFKAIDEAVGKQGFKIVLLTRLSPIFPFNLLNYAYGLTKVRFWQYVVASWLGMLPGTIMFVYFGRAAKSLTEIAAGDSQDQLATRIFLLLGLIIAIGVVVFVTHVARKALHQAVAQSDTAA
jgi:uncharacterized membrane protein YdjX (TVP38/TMEM64 family)